MRYETGNSPRRGQADSSTNALARGLGIFSIALGLAEVLAGRTLSRALGMRRQESTFRMFGFREIATGIGILVTRDPTPWIWGRVIGDALDLGLLGKEYPESGNKMRNAGIALAAVGGATAVDVYCAQRLSRESKVPVAPLRDYSDRSGLPRSPEEMRGKARDLEVPRDMRPPEAMRAYSEREEPVSEPVAGGAGI